MTVELCNRCSNNNVEVIVKISPKNDASFGEKHKMCRECADIVVQQINKAFHKQATIHPAN
jgi:hypothetical protein